MSQRIVLELLKELGGKATIKQLKELAIKKYPELSLHTYIGNRLLRLKKWDMVGCTESPSNRNVYWWIK